MASMAHMMQENIICVIFCLIKYPYPVMSFKKAIDCIAVEIPPKDIMALHKTVFAYKDSEREDMSMQPFVISSIPLSTADEMFLSTPI